MSTNVNPKTGIRYTIFSANSLDSEQVSELQMYGRDVHWESHKYDIEQEVRRAWEQGDVEGEDYEEELEMRLERESENWYDDEPVHEFNVECPGYGPVRGQTTWLGGALLVWIFESPFTSTFDLCSPCVPNCANGDSPNPDGYVGYTTPEDWRNQK